MAQAVRAHIYHRELTEESRKSCEHVTNLAALYRSQGRYGEAEPLYKQSFSTLNNILGPSHPNTLIAQKNYTGVLVQLHKDRQALSQLKTIETHLSSRAALQLATLPKDRVRRLWLRSESTFQDMPLELGLEHRLN
jgi:hypothetical protein